MHPPTWLINNPSSKLHLHKFILTQFKNYAYQELECSAGINCFIGKNGMGKTNLLDAIYYLCLSKSPFNLPDKLLVQHQNDFFRLEGRFIREEKTEKIVFKVWNGKKRELERNDIPCPRIADHVGLLPVVMIAPDDTQIATEGSEVRRRFLDNCLAQIDPEYLKQLMAYNKIISQRNALLKQFAEQGNFNAALLDIYNQQLQQPARLIFHKRQAFVVDFLPILHQTYQVISQSAENIDCVYTSDLQQADFHELLLQNQEKDRILQRTTKGIHKDDLDFQINGFPLKKFASQGQLKSFILALKLAQYEMMALEKKLPPILLLDDIFDKLDESRVENLLRLLTGSSFGQIFITDTGREKLIDLLEQLPTSFSKFIVANGQVVQQEKPTGHDPAEQ